MEEALAWGDDVPDSAPVVDANQGLILFAEE